MKKFLVSALLLLALALPVLAQAPTSYRVDTIDALLNITLYGTDAKAVAYVGGGTARDDGKGGLFFYDGNSAVATNATAVFKPKQNTGRWFKLPTAVAFQTGAATSADASTYAHRVLRDAQTIVLGMGSDNSNVYLQSFDSKPLHINNIGNNTILNATSGSVGVRVTNPNHRLGVATTQNTRGISLYPDGAYAGDSYLAFGSQFAPGDGTATSELRFYRRSPGGDTVFALDDGNTVVERMAIVGASGNVGIGTTSPTAKLHVSGDTKLGATGTAIAAIYSAAAELDFPQVDANGVTNLTITVTGAGTNSTVNVSRADGAVDAGIVYHALVNATNTVTVWASNPTVTAINPAAGSYRVTVFQY